MKNDMPRSKPLEEAEKQALWLLATGLTREQIAGELNRQFGYTHRTCLRTIDDAYRKINAFDKGEAVSIAIASDIVSIEKLRRHFGISPPPPEAKSVADEATQSTQVRGLSSSVNRSLLRDVDIGNPEKVNSWLAEGVVTRRDNPPKWEPELLDTTFDQILKTARTSYTTYQPHPLALNTREVHPVDAFYPSLSTEFERAFLTECNRIDGPWLCFMEHIPIATLPYAISEDIAKPIVDRGDAVADLASEILAHRTQFNEGFRH